MSAVELWHASGPTPTRIATVNTLGDLPPSTRINTTGRGPVDIEMNVTPTPEGLGVLHAAFAASAPGTYEIHFPETPTSAAHIWEFPGYLVHLHSGGKTTDLTWKVAPTTAAPAQDPGPPSGAAPATAGPPGAAQCMANASRLLAWAEAETDLAKMSQFNELAQTWINLASLHQAEEGL